MAKILPQVNIVEIDIYIGKEAINYIKIDLTNESTV